MSRVVERKRMFILWLYGGSLMTPSFTAAMSDQQRDAFRQLTARWAASRGSRSAHPAPVTDQV